MSLELEIKGQKPGGLEIPGVMITPPIDEGYWSYRVKLGDTGQAVVGFPKFGTIGIGFAVEEDWNTNFPYTCDVKEIFDHIEHNKYGPGVTGEIPDADVLEAIRLVKEAATQFKAATES